MQKTALLSLIALILIAAHSPAQTNTWMVYANGSYDLMNYTANTNTSRPANPTNIVGWNINTGIGYMVAGHIMVGLQGGYNSQQYPYSFYSVNGGNDLEIQVISNWQAGVFCRYTSSLEKRFYVYGQLFAGKYGNNSKTDDNNQNPTPVYYYARNLPVPPSGNGFLFNLFPAVGMNVIDGYGIHVDIGGISYTTYNATSISSQHHFNVTLGQQFSFGIHKILGWKKRTDPAPASPETKG